jgi:hypothetical protein
MMKRSMLALVLPSAAFALVMGCSNSGEVKVTVQGKGLVLSNPAGIVCDATGGKCSINLGRTFELVAEPSTGAHFDHWEGDERCTAPNTATVTIGDAPDHQVDCTAIFADDAPPAAQ